MNLDLIAFFIHAGAGRRVDHLVRVLKDGEGGGNEENTTWL
jgi:hypothetical protein